MWELTELKYIHKRVFGSELSVQKMWVFLILIEHWLFTCHEFKQFASSISFSIYKDPMRLRWWNKKREMKQISKVIKI